MSYLTVGDGAEHEEVGPLANQDLRLRTGRGRAMPTPEDEMVAPAGIVRSAVVEVRGQTASGTRYGESARDAAVAHRREIARYRREPDPARNRARERSTG